MFNQLPRCLIDSARADTRLPASMSRAGISLRLALRRQPGNPYDAQGGFTKHR